MKWLDKTGVKNGTMDAWYGDRSKSLDCINPFKLLKSFGAPTSYANTELGIWKPCTVCYTECY